MKRFIAGIMAGALLLGGSASAAGGFYFLKPGVYSAGADLPSGVYRTSPYGETSLSVFLPSEGGLSLVESLGLSLGEEQVFMVPGDAIVAVGVDVDSLGAVSSRDEVAGLVSSKAGNVSVFMKGALPGRDGAVSEDAAADVAPAEEAEGQRGGVLLYSDDDLTVEYSDFYVERLGDSAYIKTQVMFTNKTDRELHFVCDSVLVNGCAVHISKFADIPADCKYLFEWTNDGELYLKYGIEKVESFAMTFDVDHGSTIRSETVYPD